MNLLIDLSDMPDGWHVQEEPHHFRAIGATEAATISFVSDANEPRNGSSFSAFNYGTSQEASRVFNQEFVPRVLGNTPVEWISPMVSAVQSEMGCYDYEGREPLACEWSAQYEEYVIQFNTWIIPGYMSLNDLERIILTIDTKLKGQLGD